MNINGKVFLLLFLIIISGCTPAEKSYRIDCGSRPGYYDENTILFAPIINGQYQLILYNIKEQDVIRLNKDLNNCRDPFYSYDREKITFVKVDNFYHTTEICIIDSDGSYFKQLTNAGHFSEAPFFSSDGNKIYFIRRLKQEQRTGFWLYSINIDGTEETELFGPYYYIYSPRATLDGKYIIFAKMYDDEELDEPAFLIAKYEIETGKMNILLDKRRFIGLTLTNNSERIICIGDKYIYNQNENVYELDYSNVFSYNYNGEDEKFIIKAPKDCMDISISPDDKKLIYIRFGGELYEINISNSESYRLEIDEEKILALF